jgi:hypothetical protein
MDIIPQLEHDYMPKKKIKIPKQQLYHFYYRKKMSLQAIGELIGCCRETVASRLKDYGFHLRESGVWQTKYKKQDFSGDEIEKSYILGFRIGDLDVRLPYKNSKIVVVRCHTTRQDQIRMMEEVFQKYGQLVISRSLSMSKKPSFVINCNLNKTFSFLLISKPYHMDNWIVRKFTNSVAFIAGYTDAEGNFIINQDKARFKIDSYDFAILDWMYRWLEEYGIKSKLRILAKRGSLRYNEKKRWPKNLWRLNINEAYSLLRFCAFILPFSKHRKRIKDMLICITNITQRKEDETI